MANARADAYRKLARARELESEAWLELALAEESGAPHGRDDLLTYDQVAEQWGVDASHVGKLAAGGLLKVTRISSRSPRIAQSEADRYRRQRETHEA